MTRVEALLAGADPAWSIVEIGPSHAPIAPRHAGWNTTIVDYTSREGLLEKFRSDSRTDTSRIETVDVVWSAGPLDSAMPTQGHGQFDLLIASHAIEHFPDPIGVLRSAQTILKAETGIVSLAVPDKRFCFDVFRPPSTTGKLLAAHRDGRQRHSAADIFDSEAYYARRGPELAWGLHEAGPVSLANSLLAAKSAFDAANEAPGSIYRDCHAWMFTPASFELAILEIGALGLIDWRVDRMLPQPGVEFLVHLRRGRESFASEAALAERRLELLHRTVRDIEAGSKAFLHPNAPRTPPGPGSQPERVGPIKAAWRSLTPLPLRAAIARLSGRA